MQCTETANSKCNQLSYNFFVFDLSGFNQHVCSDGVPNPRAEVLVDGSDFCVIKGDNDNLRTQSLTTLAIIQPPTTMSNILQSSTVPTILNRSSVAIKMGTVTLGFRRCIFDSWWWLLEAHGVTFSTKGWSMSSDDGVWCDQSIVQWDKLRCDDGKVLSSVDTEPVSNAMVVWQGGGQGSVVTAPLCVIRPSSAVEEVLEDTDHQWASQKLISFAKTMGFSFGGFEREAVKLFLALVQNGGGGVSKPNVQRSYARRVRGKKGCCELRRLESSINYEDSSSSGKIRSRRSRGVLLLK